ncbi:3511_t:CDS:2, partial [Gigaspora rosea]
KGKKELPCPITAFDSKDTLAEQASLRRKTRMDNHIEILNPTNFEFIKRALFSSLQHNIEEGRRELSFYIDGSLLLNKEPKGAMSA